MFKRLRIAAGLVSWLFLGLLVVLLAVSIWAMAPFRLQPFHVIRTAEIIAKAPFASRLVIGDSRVQFASAPEGVLFAGYGGATSRHVERVSGLLCAISDAQVTIALGINDTKPYEHDAAASRAALTSIADSCARDRLWFSAIWPAEADQPPGGHAYDPRMTRTLDAFLYDLAEQRGAGFVAAPELDTGYTYDGVHFTAPVSRDYAQRLSFPERFEPRG